MNTIQINQRNVVAVTTGLTSILDKGKANTEFFNPLQDFLQQLEAKNRLPDPFKNPTQIAFQLDGSNYEDNLEQFQVKNGCVSLNVQRLLFAWAKMNAGQLSKPVGTSSFDKFIIHRTLKFDLVKNEHAAADCYLIRPIFQLTLPKAYVIQAMTHSNKLLFVKEYRDLVAMLGSSMESMLKTAKGHLLSDKAVASLDDFQNCELDIGLFGYKAIKVSQLDGKIRSASQGTPAQARELSKVRSFMLDALNVF